MHRANQEIVSSDKRGEILLPPTITAVYHHRLRFYQIMSFYCYLTPFFCRYFGVYGQAVFLCNMRQGRRAGRNEKGEIINDKEETDILEVAATLRIITRNKNMNTNTKLVLAVAAIALFAVCAMTLRGPEQANANAQITMPILQQQKVETMENSTLENELLVLRLLSWDGHPPKEHVAKFEKQIEEKYGRKVKLVIEYVSGADDFL